MNPFYPCSEQSAHIRPVRYRRRRLHFCGHILFLLALFLMKAGWVNGQDDNHLDGASDRNEIIGAGYDDYGAYVRSEEHTSELQSLMRISYAVLCLKKKKYINRNKITQY